MANEPTMTLIGNLTGDPELRYVSSGTPVASFTVASTPRTQNKHTQQWEDGETLFVRCSVWREYAEHVAESLKKGTRVLVTGKLTSHSYEHEGHKRTALELQVDEIGPSLRYATVQVTRATLGSANGFGTTRVQEHTNGGFGPQNEAYDPWATNEPAPF